MTPDDYETVTVGRPPKPRSPRMPYTANERESFWLLVGCVGASGIAIGMSFQSIVYQIAEAIGG